MIEHHGDKWEESAVRFRQIPEHRVQGINTGGRAAVLVIMLALAFSVVALMGWRGILSFILGFAAAILVAVLMAVEAEE